MSGVASMLILLLTVGGRSRALTRDCRRRRRSEVGVPASAGRGVRRGGGGEENKVRVLVDEAGCIGCERGKPR